MSSATSTDARRRILIFGIPAALVGGFLALLAVYYQARFTVATLFWVIGWCSFLGAAYFLFRSAMAFDPAATAETLGATLTVDDRRRAELEREKRILLKAIKEVEFDQALGKVDDADALEIVNRYRTRAREIIKLLEGDKSGDYEKQVEKELAKRLAKAGVSADVAPAAVAGVCGACATRNDDDAAFCKKCGAKL